MTGGGASLAVQTAASLAAAALMVVAGLGKHRLEKRPVPRTLRDRWRTRRP